MLIVLIANKVTCQSSIWMTVFVSFAGSISLMRISAGYRAFVWWEEYWAGFIWSSDRIHVDVIWRFLESIEISTKLQIVCGCVVGWVIFSKYWQNGHQRGSTSSSHIWKVIDRLAEHQAFFYLKQIIHRSTFRPQCHLGWEIRALL